MISENKEKTALSDGLSGLASQFLYDCEQQSQPCEHAESTLYRMLCPGAYHHIALQQADNRLPHQTQGGKNQIDCLCNAHPVYLLSRLGQV